MTNDTIPVSTKKIVAGQEFYNVNFAQAVRDVKAPTKDAPQGYDALFMPKIIDTRIDSLKGARIWQTWFSAPSIRATGRTKQGNPVVIYAHVPNYFSNPDNIDKAVQMGLINGAAQMPQGEFQALLDLQDNKSVFAIDYNALKNSSSGVISLKKALQHPQTIPFVGGKDRAEQYLDKLAQVYGENSGVWHVDDLHEQVLARPLVVGGGSGGLDGGNFYNFGRFVGVRAGGASGQNFSPTLEQIANVMREYIAPRNQAEVTERLAPLFR